MIIEVYVLAASKIVLKNAAYRMSRVTMVEQDPKQVNLLRILFEQTRMKAKQFLDLSRKVCRYSEYSLKESYRTQKSFQSRTMKKWMLDYPAISLKQGVY